mmetsp:Transcript_13840/g.29845  ORF Transcript_13840/g.29845 Transcript_13840/m.29845 type:complete len:1094 (+) Transcript_13840:144-3425(+)
MFRPKRRRKSTTSSSYSPLKSEQFNDSIYNSSTDSSTRPSDSEGSYRFHAAKIQQSRSFDTKRTTATITMRRRMRSTSRSRGEIGDPQRISRSSNSRGRQSSSSGEQKLQQRVDTPPPTAPNSNIGSQHNGASSRGRGGRSVPFTSRGSRAASPKHNGSSSVREEQEGLKTKQVRDGSGRDKGRDRSKTGGEKRREGRRNSMSSNTATNRQQGEMSRGREENDKKLSRRNSTSSNRTRSSSSKPARDASYRRSVTDNDGTTTRRSKATNDSSSSSEKNNNKKHKFSRCRNLPDNFSKGDARGRRTTSSSTNDRRRRESSTSRPSNRDSGTSRTRNSSQIHRSTTTSSSNCSPSRRRSQSIKRLESNRSSSRSSHPETRMSSNHSLDQQRRPSTSRYANSRGRVQRSPSRCTRHRSSSPRRRRGMSMPATATRRRTETDGEDMTSHNHHARHHRHPDHQQHRSRSSKEGIPLRRSSIDHPRPLPPQQRISLDEKLSPPLPSPPTPPPGKSPPRTRQSALDGNAKSLNLLSSQLSGLNFEDGTTPRDTAKADTTAPTIVAADFDTALVPRSRSCSSESRERMPFLPSLSSNKRDHSLSRALAAGGERSSNALVAKEEESSALVAREEPEYSLVASGEHLSNVLVVAEKSFNELIVTDDRVSQDQSRVIAENSTHSDNDEEVAGERTLALGHSYRPKSSYSNTRTPEVNCDDITPKTSQKGRRRFDSTAFSTTDNSLSLQEVNKIDFKDLADFVTGRKGKEALASIDVEDDSMLCSANDGTPSSKVKEAVNTKKIEKIVKKVSKMRPLERSLYRSRFFPPKRTLDSTNWKSQSSLDVLPPPPITFEQALDNKTLPNLRGKVSPPPPPPRPPPLSKMAPDDRVDRTLSQFGPVQPATPDNRGFLKRSASTGCVDNIRYDATKTIPSVPLQCMQRRQSTGLLSSTSAAGGEEIARVADMPYTDKVHGSGRYSGEVDQWGRPHGRGVLKYDSGMSFDGNWTNGVATSSDNGAYAGESVLTGSALGSSSLRDRSRSSLQSNMTPLSAPQMTYTVEMKPPAPNMPMMNNQQAVVTGNVIHPYHAMMMMSRQQQQMMNMNRR